VYFNRVTGRHAFKEFDNSKSHNFKPSFKSKAFKMVLLYTEQESISLIFVCLISYINTRYMYEINER
jgi:hypothetical protein